MSAWNVAYVAPFSGRAPKPIVTVGPLWAEIVPFIAERLSTNGDLVRCVDSVDGAADLMIALLPGGERG
jgi:hypothetical protein